MAADKRKLAWKALFILVAITLFMSHIFWQSRRLTPSRPVENTTGLPEGFGISAEYSGDIGLKNDSHVIFTEDFETETLRDVFSRWDSVSNADGKRMELVLDKPSNSTGDRSLTIVSSLLHENGRVEFLGGNLYKRLDNETNLGYDQVYVRFYVKFAEDNDYVHHFVHLIAQRPPTSWPEGRAGTRPEGEERFSTGLEPLGGNGRYPPPGIWNFYTYWHEMIGVYGNSFVPEKPVTIKRGEWICMEFMVKTNTAPEKADGEQAFWMNGKLAGRWVGFRWRTTNDLKINSFWLLFYTTIGNMDRNNVEDPNPLQRVFFDDIVIATEYIGPIKPADQTS